MNKFLDLLKNKYFLSGLAFLVWMLFFDRNDLVSQYEYHSQVNKLEEDRDFYVKEIEKVEKDLTELTSNKRQLEKFARERYLMKRDDEDVFVIVETKEEKDGFFN